MSAPQPPADGRPRDDEPRSGEDTAADGATGTYEFHGEKLDFDPYRFGRPEEPPPAWTPTAPGSPGAAPAPGDRWSPGSPPGDPGVHDVRPGDYWNGAGSHRGPFPPAGYVPPGGTEGPDRAAGGDPTARVDLGKPAEGGSAAGSDRRDAWAPPTGYPAPGGPTGGGYPPTQPPPPYHGPHHPAPGAYPGAPTPTLTRSGNGLAVAGLVVGLVGALLAVTSWPGILIGLVGLGLAIPGLVRARRGASGKGLAVAGIALSTIAVVVGAIVLVVYLQRVDFGCVERAGNNFDQAQECIR